MAEAVQQDVDEVVKRGCHADVGDVIRGLAPGRSDLLDRLPEHLLAPRDQEHLHSGARQRQGEGEPLSGRSSGDQRDFSFERLAGHAEVLSRQFSAEMLEAKAES